MDGHSEFKGRDAARYSQTLFDRVVLCRPRVSLLNINRNWLICY